MLTTSARLAVVPHLLDYINTVSGLMNDGENTYQGHFQNKCAAEGEKCNRVEKQEGFFSIYIHVKIHLLLICLLCFLSNPNRVQLPDLHHQPTINQYSQSDTHTVYQKSKQTYNIHQRR